MNNLLIYQTLSYKPYIYVIPDYADLVLYDIITDAQDQCPLASILLPHILGIKDVESNTLEKLKQIDYWYYIKHLMEFGSLLPNLIEKNKVHLKDYNEIFLVLE